MSTHVFTQMYIYVQFCTCIYTHTYIYTHIHGYTHMHIHAHIQAHTRIFVHIYINIVTNTFTLFRARTLAHRVRVRTVAPRVYPLRASSIDPETLPKPVIYL